MSLHVSSNLNSNVNLIPNGFANLMMYSMVAQNRNQLKGPSLVIVRSPRRHVHSAHGSNGCSLWEVHWELDCQSDCKCNDESSKVECEFDYASDCFKCLQIAF